MNTQKGTNRARAFWVRLVQSDSKGNHWGGDGMKKSFVAVTVLLFSAVLCFGELVA